MSKTSPVPEALPAASAGNNHLDSWKEIAAYLKRDVRTLQRWEKQENLPVRRHRHDRLGSVFAYKSELDAWRLDRQLPPQPHAVSGQEVKSGKIRLLVLPFENLSGDPAQSYFSDGLTEEMITQLSRLEPQRLGVIGRTTAMQYKGSSTRIDEIGQELRVDYILEGSTRRYTDRVRIAAQLVRAKDQTHLWAETYATATFATYLPSRATSRKALQERLVSHCPPESKRAWPGSAAPLIPKLMRLI